MFLDKANPRAVTVRVEPTVISCCTMSSYFNPQRFAE